MTTKKVSIDISLKSYLLAATVFLSVVFLRHILSILILLFVAFLVKVAISPPINFLETRKIPRSVSAFFILILTFSGLVVLVASMISPLISQTISFLQQLPPLIEKLAPYNINVSSILTPQITSAPSNVIKIAVGTFSSALALFTLIVVSYYMIQSQPHMRKYLVPIFGSKRADLYLHAIEKLEVSLGYWVRGQLFLMTFVGLLNYFGFILIGLPSAIPLAVIAGVLELVPNIGPTVAAIPAVLVGFSISPTHGLLTLGLAILIQQIENNIIVPKIMEKAVGLHPVFIIIALSIGYKLGGPVLAVLALPLVLSVRVVYAHLHPPVKEEIKEEIVNSLAS